MSRHNLLRSFLHGLGAVATVTAWQPALADAVTDWNQTATHATEIAGAPGPVETRVMAIVHAAIFDAVNAIDRKYSVYATEITAAPGASADAAAIAAGHGILERLYPLQKSMLDAALKTSMDRIADGPAKLEGSRVGREVAEKLFASRKDDGSSVQASYEFGSGQGVYQATPPRMIKPVLPQWRGVKPFVLTSAMQFPLAGPPAVGSAAYARDLAEVKRLGSAGSTERTALQTAIAIHWVGSEVATINDVGRAVSADKKLGLADNARLFALLNLSMADALIAGYEAKYTYNHWRPITAIRNAPSTSDPALAADPAWEPLITTPSHPEYPSAHALATGAGVAVLQATYGSDNFSASHPYPAGLLRRWTSFSEIARECEDARVWSGIHFRTADQHGTQLGRQVAEFAMKTWLLPNGH